MLTAFITDSTRLAGAIGWIFFGLFLTDCKNKGEQNDSINTSVHVDSIKINVENQFAYTYTSTSLFQTDTSSYIFLSDPLRRMISVIDLGKAKFLFNIGLKDEGPHEVQNIGWFQCIGVDSILTVTNDFFYIFDWRGEIVKKMKLIDAVATANIDLSGNKMLITSNNFVNKSQSSFYFINVNLRIPPSNPAFFNEPLVGTYNYLSNEISALPVFLPVTARTSNLNYDLNSYPLITVHGEVIYYIFPFSESVFLFDGDKTRELYSNKKSTIKPLENRYADNVLQKAIYMETSARYKALLFDERNNLVYQLYDFAKENFGDQTDFKILIRDSSFKTISEVRPDKNIFPTGFLFEGRLYFRKRDTELRNGAVDFIRYEIKNEVQRFRSP